jgi:hypothetical protein
LAPPIVFPAVQLRKRSIDDRAFRDWYLVRDDPSITQDDHMLVNAIANEAKEHINDFDHIPEGDRGAALEAVVTGFEEVRLSAIDVFENDQIVKLKSVEHLGGMLPGGITKLDLRRNNLRSLKGIERFPKLTELNVDGNEQLEQLNEVGALPALRAFTVDGNRVNDLTALVACTQLERVTLGQNRITDLTPLAQLSKLTSLVVEASLVGVGDPNRPQTFNPVTHAAGLQTNPALANPFLLGRTVDVRLGKPGDGPDAQLTGRATRVGDSLKFDVELVRGGQTVRDTWHLIQVNASPDTIMLGPEGSQLVVLHVESLGFAVFSWSLADDRPNAIVDRQAFDPQMGDIGPSFDATLVDPL